MDENAQATTFSIPEILVGSTGQRMPVLGLGTATSPLVGSETIKLAILDAIKLGYRHLDTATLYQTEEPLGEAIEEALSLGIIKSRDELFITTKLWCSDAHPDLVLPALQKSLSNLQLKYIDMYLIHWPVISRPGTYEFPIKKEDFMPMDFTSLWGAMEECQRNGLTKAIGVSNFSSKKLADILAIAKIPPAVNQVEMSPLWQQNKLMEFCKANGVLMMAYAALGGLCNRVWDCEVLNEIARARGKTVAQVCLRWAYEQGVSVVAKSFNTERMKENRDIFEWALTEEDCERIKDLPQGRIVRGEDYISPYGPYKSLEDLWDGET